MLAFAPPFVVLLVVAAVWRFGDLHAFDSPERFAELARGLRENPLGPVYTLLAFGVGTLLFLPITPFVLGTTLAFEPLYGFIYASLGVLFAASLTYGAGRLFGGAAIERLSGPRLTKLAGELRANAFRASIAARLLPVGHFTVINMLAGSLRIPFLSFFLGSMVGAVPAVAVTALFADRLWHALRSRAARDVIFLVGAVALVVALSFAARWALRRRNRAGADEQPGA